MKYKNSHFKQLNHKTNTKKKNLKMKVLQAEEKSFFGRKVNRKIIFFWRNEFNYGRSYLLF